jgi:hypothetical protein
VNLRRGCYQEDEIGEGRQAIVNFVHGRPYQSPCQGKLMISSKIFFAGFELLTFVVNGIAKSDGRVHAYLRRFGK